MSHCFRHQGMSKAECLELLGWFFHVLPQGHQPLWILMRFDELDEATLNSSAIFQSSIFVAETINPTEVRAKGNCTGN